MSSISAASEPKVLDAGDDTADGRPDATIVDCGIGNIRSVQRMIEVVEGSAEIIDDPAALSGCKRLILPGVGAFDAGMAALESGGWVGPLERLRAEGVPILGICLGMQLLCRRSEEGIRPGLGWVQADVVRVDIGERSDLKIPHMGWSVTRPANPNPLLPDGDDEQRFYYVHKYRAVCDRPEDVLCTADYGTEFVSGVQDGNVMGVQFHPEKSHRFGMALIRRFIDVPC